MSTNPDTTRKLIFSVLQFLNKCLQDGTVRADDVEGIEVAVQCIGAAFDVDPSTDTALAVSTPLPVIFSSHLASESAPKAAPSPTPAPSAADKAAAEKHKASGNAHMSAKRYPEAIDEYTQAISLDPSNPVYYSNRAAAHSSINDHASAVEDATQAIEVDPGFVKAYSRLGHAYYSLKEYSKAMNAFEKGLTLDPGNSNLKMGLDNAKARAPGEEEAEEIDPRREVGSGATPGAGAGGGLGGLADMMAGLGGMGRGGGGGMPDLSALLQNPQMMQMAQNMMANGGLEQLMSNPMFRNMAEQFGAGRGA